MTESRIPEGLATGFLAILGMWTLHAWAFIYTGSSFAMLRLLLPVSLGIGGVATWWLLRESMASPEPAAPEAPPPQTQSAFIYRVGTLLLAAAVLATWHLGSAPFFMVWIAALIHLGTMVPSAVAVAPAAPIRAEARDLGALAVAAVIAVVATTGLNRPDIDDAYYFNAVLSALAHPELAALSFDGMHGDVTVPIQQLIHRPQAYELLAAVVASVPGISAASAYYVVLPAVMAAAMPLAYWMLAKACTPRTAWLAILLSVAMLLAWGDGHRTFGNFAFVRLFQGKSGYMCVLIPLVVWAGWAFGSAPSRSSWLRLLLAQSAAAGLTSSALVITPICAALAVLAAAQPTRRGLLVLGAGALTSLPLIATLGMLQWEMHQLGPLISGGEIMGMDSLIGTGWRAPLSLFGLLALPFLAHTGAAQNAAWVTRYVGLAFLFVFNGVSGPFLGQWVSELLSWRIYWAIPLPALVAAALATALLGPRDETNSTTVTKIGAALALWMFVSIQPWTIDGRNHVSFEWAAPKRPEWEMVVAKKIVELATPDSLALAPPQIAVWITGLADRPSLVAIRKHYIDNLSRHWGVEESRARLRLMRFAEGRQARRAGVKSMNALVERCVDIVALHRRVANIPYVRAGLRARGYKSEPTGRYIVWTLDTQAHESCSR